MPLYCLQLFFVYKEFVLCTYTDPGIIPNIQSNKIDYSRSYYVIQKDVISYTAEMFFSNDKYQVAEMCAQSDLLSYCVTCQIIRPPRSFHCSTCGVCIEVHDHHCPVMGTCIGRRNIRHFILFLLNAAAICLVTALICYFYYKQQGFQ